MTLTKSLLDLGESHWRTVNVHSQVHVVLEVLEVVTHQVGNDMILLRQLVLQILIVTLQGMELLLKGLNPAKLFSLHDYCIVYMAHPIFSLLEANQ